MRSVGRNNCLHCPAKLLRRNPTRQSSEIMSMHSIDEDRDPFAASRRDNGYVLGVFRGEEIPMILRHQDVREAARNWSTYSSNSPCRVPIPDEKDVRSVRQLPIEIDPPAHTEYRKLVLPIFLRARGPQMKPAITRILDALIDTALKSEKIEVVREFSLPLQSQALARMLGLPCSEAERFIEWDRSVFRASGCESDQEKSSRFDKYIKDALDEALEKLARRADEQSQDGQEAGLGEDFFTHLARGKVFGRPLTREEMIGYANLTFAAGRDTVIHYVSECLAYLADHPEELERIRVDRSLIASALEEFARYFGPLTHIGRVLAKDTDLFGRSMKEDERVSLCWASANRDESVFENPSELRIDRKPNPHLAFGYAAHRCLGAHLARLIMRQLLERLAERVGLMQVLDREVSVEDHGVVRRRVGYNRLVMRFEAL